MKRILIVLLIIGTALGLTACGGSGSDSKEEEKKTEFQLGETAVNEGVEYTVTSFSASEGSEYDKPEDGKIYAIVHIRIANQSQDKISYNIYDWKMVNANGQEDDPAITLEVLSSPLNSGDLIAGGTVEGDIVFEEPAEGTLKLNYYANSLFDDQAAFDFVVRP